MWWLLFACNPSAGRFYKQAFELSCEQWAACDPDDFALHYGSVDACFEAEWDNTGTYIVEYERDGCVYDSANARQCLADLHDIDCEVWLDDTTAPASCFDVWACEE